MSWYEQQGGLRFECSACGDCCTGEPGAIWVNADEIADLAGYLEMDTADFEREYVRRLGIRRSLYERFDGDCILFDKQTRRCTVYAARPTQCRTWPFWDRNVESKETWDVTCQECPGSGTGPLVPLARITQQVVATRRARKKV